MIFVLKTHCYPTKMYLSPINLIEPTFQFLSLVGICPHTLKDDSIPLTKKISIFLLALYPTYFLIEVILSSYENEQDITAFVFVVGTLFEWLSYLAAVITPLQNASALVKFFKIVEDAQQTIGSLDITQPETPTR